MIKKGLAGGGLALALVASAGFGQLPGRAQAPALTIAAPNGDRIFRVRGAINGTALTFLMDTGSSDVTLSQADARRIGIDAARLVFNQLSSTANGVTRFAPIRLPRLVIGSCVFTDVSASVSRGGLKESLLGMSALQRMYVTISHGTMTLRC